jgi:hypothetical protein
MPFYEWRGVGAFQDNLHGREVAPGDVVELSEDVVGNHDFVEVDAPDESDTTESSEPADDESGNEDSEEASDEAPDYASMDYSSLRELAVEADTDEINGRSSKEDIIAYFESHAE